jgi:porin
MTSTGENASGRLDTLPIAWFHNRIFSRRSLRVKRATIVGWPAKSITSISKQLHQHCMVLLTRRPAVLGWCGFDLGCTARARAGFWGACFVSVTLSNVALAQDPVDHTVQPTAHSKAKVSKAKVKGANSHKADAVKSSTETKATTTPAAFNAVTPMATTTPPAFNLANQMVKGWNIPYPTASDTITQDYNGYRSKLAEYGFGINTTIFTQNADNLLNTPRSNNGQQAYWGQRNSFGNTGGTYLTYDMSQYGIPNGQIVAAAGYTYSTWDPYSPNTLRLQQLSYYQTLLDKRLELKIGYNENSKDFIGASVGGTYSSALGASASIPVEVGLTAPPFAEPTARFTYHITDTLYEEFAVARSISPTAGATLAERNANPTGLDFSQQGAQALYIDELGYQQAAAPGVFKTWLRAGMIYNTSLYKNYATGGESTNYGIYALADRQLLQLDPSSTASAYRGIYMGASAMYAPPETNIFSQYYAARLFVIGPFSGREKDQISLVYEYNVLSSSFAALTNSTAATTGVFANHQSQDVSLVYSYRLDSGVYLSLDLEYINHPSATFVANEGNALNFVVGLLTIW